MNKIYILSGIARDCNSDRITSIERVSSAWCYCKCFGSERDGLETLKRELSKKHLEVLEQAAAKILGELEPESLGYYTGGVHTTFDVENLVSREFISALAVIDASKPEHKDEGLK